MHLGVRDGPFAVHFSPDSESATSHRLEQMAAKVLAETLSLTLLVTTLIGLVRSTPHTTPNPYA